ncbi:MAG: SRPBCC domain-containing protein [Terriglobales bacterium]|jgi:uncharacterized protein YndB with AHSA1/START domain
MATVMPQAIVTADQDAVICEVQIAAPAEKVFNALISCDLLMRWWNGEGGPCRVKVWEFEPRIGGRVRHVAYDPTGQMKVNGVTEFEIRGEVVEFDPPRMLAYTWRANFHSLPDHNSLVRWELSGTAGGTLVKMTHSQLRAIGDAPGYAHGWPGVIASLVRFAQEGTQGLSWAGS